MTNSPATRSSIPLAEQARVAVATTALNAISRVARRFDDPMGALDAPGGPADRLALHRSLLSAGPFVQSRLGTYLTATHAGCHAVFTSPHASSMPKSARSAVERLLDPTLRVDAGEPFDASFISMDAPDHTRLRRLVQRGFTPKSIAEHEALIRRTADELIDAFPTHGDVDLVESFARPLPMRVITRLLGIPDADLAAFDRWGEHLVTALDRPRSLREATDVRHALVDIDRAFRELVAERRRRPGDDLISVLAEQADGDTLTDDELVGTLSLLMIAGFETTVNLIGTGTATLVAHRDQLELLAADPETHLANTVEEALRYESPVQFTLRRALAPIELAPGHVIPAGGDVVTVIAAANRDPQVFADPDRFDITRPNARRHLAFVTGPHACLGGALARLEARVAWQALLHRFPDVTRWRTTGAPTDGPSQIIRGYQHLPMRFA
jgi:cytochrome P450